MDLNGILIIDKPANWTSHDVVAKLRGALKQKRIGHGGTLDPMATGVLPVFIDRATRAAEFCENAEKEYIAGLRLGIVTDTQDITGKILSETEVNVTINDILEVLPRFLGAQKQTPPMYSAIKQDGKKLYELARKGIEVERPGRDILISELELVTGTEEPKSPFDIINNFTFRAVCSKGTYIRTLCHDIGAMLGCGGTLSSLRRIKAGAFTIDMAHTLDAVIAATLTDSVNDILLPVDSIFTGFPSISLSPDETRKAKNGALRHVEEIPDGKYRIYSPDDEFLLFGETKNGKLNVIKNFFRI